MGNEKKVAVITGGNTGIGFATARRLLEKGGFEVVIGSRDAERSKEAVAALQKAVPGAVVTALPLDLGSLASVKTFAASVRARWPKVHLLINNAAYTGMHPLTSGAASNTPMTVDGFERTIGTNHIGHFLLAAELLPALAAARPSRIVSVGSMAHYDGKLDREDPMKLRPGAYSGFAAYQNSKLFNTLFAEEWQRRYGAAGITATSVHPGVIPITDIGRHQTGFVKVVLGALYYLGRVIGFTQTIEDGATAEIAAAFHPTGGVYLDTIHGVKAVSAAAADLDNASWLWARTEQWAGVTLPQTI